MPHIHDKYDFVVNVFIVYGNKVLLVHHPRYDMWLPMGGHIELNEDPEQALFREVKEETGLEVKLLTSKPDLKSSSTKFLHTPNFMDVHTAQPPHKHIALIYFAKAESQNHTKSEEHLDIKWLSESDLGNKAYKLAPAVKFYALEAIKTASR